MQITDVKIKVFPDDKRLKAVASVTFDNSFAIHDIKIIEGPDKLFLAMPSKKLIDGSFRDIAHPINRETRELLEKSVISAYGKAIIEE